MGDVDSQRDTSRKFSGAIQRDTHAFSLTENRHRNAWLKSFPEKPAGHVIRPSRAAVSVFLGSPAGSIGPATRSIPVSRRGKTPVESECRSGSTIIHRSEPGITWRREVNVEISFSRRIFPRLLTVPSFGGGKRSLSIAATDTLPEEYLLPPPHS